MTALDPTALDPTSTDGSAASDPAATGGREVLSSGQSEPGTEAVRARRQLRRPAPSRRLSRVHGQRGPRDDAPPMPLTAAGDGPGAPLGVLIGGSVGRPEPAGASGRRTARRVAVELVRVGRGTTQAVLPEWRAAIAISVPTEQLLTSTGLGLDALASARLSVLIYPDALHDRELGLHAWQVEPEVTDRRAARGRGSARRRPGA